MRTVIAVTLLGLLAAGPVAAQQTGAGQAAQVRQGARKVKIGLALVGAGLLVLPLSAGLSGHDTGEWTTGAGVGLTTVGGSLIWLGAREQRKAVRPQTTIGLVVVGRTKEIQIRRRW